MVSPTEAWEMVTSDAEGIGPLLVVDLDAAASTARVAERLGGVPCVTVGVARGPVAVPPPGFDVLLSAVDDTRPWRRCTDDSATAESRTTTTSLSATAPSGGVPTNPRATAESTVSPAVARLADAVAASPQAAVVLVQVLRLGRGRPLEDCLTIESLAYGTLQAGAEHQKWLATSAPPRRAVVGDDPVVVERQGDTLVVTLRRPAVRNAVDTAVRDGLVAAFDLAAHADLDVELRGEGPDFCSGGDLAEFGTTPDPATAHLVRSTRSPARALAAVAGRTTVHVQGACIGAGVELAALAGRVVATPDATFRLPELAMGLIPGAGGTATIPRRIGPERTAWLALTGEALDAPTALAWGLIDEIAP